MIIPGHRRKHSMSKTPSTPAASAHLARGQRVIDTEANGLRVLARSLEPSFDAAVAALLRIEGQVIVSGMGKSGHVARKIAATFASTGTRAAFVHPAEASHGDLGMVSAQDVIIMLSNSGETAELSDMIEYSRRHRILLIGITGGATSTLARVSDITLLLPPVPEACSLGLAPTTSTTMQLALGDALAVAAYEARDFSPEQFRSYHPGGKLGQQLKRVRDLMHLGADVPVVARSSSMDQAILTMTQKAFGCVAVTDADGDLLGIITDGDLRRHMGPGLLSRQVEEVMTANPKTVGPEVTAAEALRLMNSFKVQSLLVVAEESRRPIGIIRIHDCLRAGMA